MTVTRNYEALIILDSQLEEEQRNELWGRLKALIESYGKIDTVDEWGTRKLAYPINDQNEGYYILIEFSATPDFPQEFERVMKINEGVYKYLILNKDE